MRGNGTFVSGDGSGGLVASVAAGAVVPINRLVSVVAAGSGRFAGDIGDVVMGRIG